MKNSTVGFAIFVASLAFLLVYLFVIIAGNPNVGFREESFFQNYPGLIVAMASGFFGATFSMLLQSRKRGSQGSLEDISAASSWTTLTVRGSVGLGAAAVLYFFFRSGLLQGTLWPDLAKLAFESLGEAGPPRVPNQPWCLLIIWCFIAGFSETFVPDILARTEAKSQITKETA